jgi:hypothetical protein
MEIWWKSFVGEDFFRIAQPEAQGLELWYIARQAMNYERLLLDQVTRNKIIQKLHSIYKNKQYLSHLSNSKQWKYRQS